MSRRHNPTYTAWAAAKQRCFNPNNTKYRDYGGRGITMCPQWRDSYECFLRDMGEKPPRHCIDRIDVDGNYEPTNCRWADNYTSILNRRVNVRFRVDVSWLQRIDAIRNHQTVVVDRGEMVRRLVDRVLDAPGDTGPLALHRDAEKRIDAWLAERPKLKLHRSEVYWRLLMIGLRHAE